MIARIARKLGMEFERRDIGGKLEEYRLLVRPHERLEITVIPAVIEGQRIRFAINFRDDHIQRHHFRGEFYEADELAVMARYFRGGTFVDIGANIGNHVLYAAKFMGAEKIIAFEPGDLAATLLRCNVALNDIQSMVDVRQVGLSDKPGTATFDNAMPYNLGGARVLIDKPGDTQIVRGDDALRDDRVDFIKIDTEGLEVEVLRGLRQTLLNKRPPVWVEVEDRHADATNELFESVGYRVAERLPSYDALANWVALPA